jgi:2-dehydropantoate 2-reductase
MIGVKYAQLPQAVADIAPCVGENTVILSLLNGIDTEEALQAAYGKDKVPRCFVVAIDTLRVGTTINTHSHGRIVFGFDDNKKHADQLARIGRLLGNCGIDYVISDRMEREQWWKFMLNAAMNQLSAVLDITYGAFKEDTHIRELCRLVCEEVVAVAGSMGVSMDESDIDRFYKVIPDLSETGITSMCADVRGKRPTEVEMLAGVINRLGRLHGVPTPYNTALYHMIRYIESHY